MGFAGAALPSHQVKWLPARGGLERKFFPTKFVSTGCFPDQSPFQHLGGKFCDRLSGHCRCWFRQGGLERNIRRWLYMIMIITLQPTWRGFCLGGNLDTFPVEGSVGSGDAGSGSGTWNHESQSLRLSYVATAKVLDVV